MAVELDEEERKLLQEKGPCPGCEHFNRCRDLSLACLVYNDYLSTGIVSTKWERTPTAQLHDEIFSGHED